MTKYKNILLKYRLLQKKLTPQQNLLIGFLLYAIVGSLLLSIPLLQKENLAFIDCLFFSTSALSTTGLVTKSTYDSFNFGGQLIILILIQIGGIGYMTFSSFLLLSRKNIVSKVHYKILNTEFTLPNNFVLSEFIKSVIIYTFVIESVGAALLYIHFTNAGVENNFALWSSIFHSISGFCTAGFSLYNNSFETFANNVQINWILSVLGLLGSFGFIFLTDVWSFIKRKTKSITYTTKIIFFTNVLIISISTAVIYFFEPSVQNYQEKFWVSFFQSVTAITTTGYNSIPVSGLSVKILVIIMFLMFIGASPSGTGGGIKTTTFTALIAILWSRIRNKSRVSFWGNNIPTDRLYVATSVFISYTIIIFISTLLLSFTELDKFESLLFESISAIGTVGLSTGTTSNLTLFGKINLIFVMFIGRLGVLTFGYALLAKRKHEDINNNNHDLAV